MKTLTSLLLSGMVFAGCVPVDKKDNQKFTPFNMGDGTNFVEYMIVDANQDGSWDFIAENVPGRTVQKIVLLRDKNCLTNSLAGYDVSSDTSIADTSVSTRAGWLIDYNRSLRTAINDQFPLLLTNKIISVSTNLNTH